MVTFAQAKTPKTAATLRASFLAALVGAPVAGWSVSAPQRKIVEAFSARLAEETDLRAMVAQSIDLSVLTSRDDDWTDALLTWFGETRIPALPAVWDVALTVSTTAAPVTISPSTTLQIQASGGAIFEIDPLYHTSAVTLSSGSSYAGTARLRARAPGTVGNVSGATLAAGKILTGPSGLTIASATLYTAGRDIETSEQALARALGKWSRLGAGWTIEAFDYLIPTAAPTVTRWLVRDDNPFGPGTVGVTLANASGPATSPEVAAVLAYLGSRSVKPLGSGALTVAAAAAQNIALTAALNSDGTNASLADDAEAAILAFFAAFPIGPATVDDSIVRAILLGGDFASIPIVTGSTTRTIAPDLAGFTGATSIASLSYGAPLSISSGSVPVATAAVT